MTRKNSRMRLGRDLVVAAFVFGCASCDSMWATHAYTALEIQQVQVLESGECAVPGEATTLHRTEGVLDVDLPDGVGWPYYLPVVVANNLDSFSGGGANTPAEEMNNITLSHFTVELSGPAGVWSDACPGTFDTKAFSFRLSPGETTGAGLDALSSAHSLCLRSVVADGPVVVTASIRAKGRHGGNTVASAPLVYPITVCAGCMQQGYTDPALVPYSYPQYPYCDSLAGTNPYTGNSCLSPGQDDLILCCSLSDGRGICPGVFTGTSTTTPP